MKPDNSHALPNLHPRLLTCCVRRSHSEAKNQKKVTLPPAYTPEGVSNDTQAGGRVITKNGSQAIEQNDTPNLKKILLELIKQNEHLDDVIDEMKDSGHNLNLVQISSFDLTFSIINENLKRISILAENELIKPRPIDGSYTYTKTILSHADKLNKKIYRVQNSVKKSLSKKSILRDAPANRQTANSGKTKKIKGKNLAQIIKEQKAIHKLAKNIKQLKISSKKLRATSKWLFIVNK